MQQTPQQRARIEAMIAAGQLSPAARHMDYERVMEQHREANGVPAEPAAEPEF